MNTAFYQDANLRNERDAVNRKENVCDQQCFILNARDSFRVKGQLYPLRILQVVENQIGGQ